MCWHVCVWKLISGMWHNSLVDVYQITWHRIPQDSNIHSHCCENQKSHMFFFLCKVTYCYFSILQICMESVPLILYECQTWFLDLKEEYSFRVQSAEENIWTRERERYMHNRLHTCNLCCSPVLGLWNECQVDACRRWEMYK